MSNTNERAELIHWLRERSMWDGMLRLIDAADMLAADANKAQQVAVPAGMELVPIEPTLEMIMAMEYEWMYGSNSDMAKREYKAMLAAAQGAKQ